MYLTPCPLGRAAAVALAAMNMRGVIDAANLSYVIPPGPRRAPKGKVTARYQPRNALGQFVSFAELRRWIAYGIDATWLEADKEDRQRPTTPCGDPCCRCCS